MEKILFYREPAPKLVKKGKAVIMDRGQLMKALPDSHGDYLFSEAGIGVRSLVLVGDLYAITEFLYKNSSKRIHNTISELPNVYLSAGSYKPNKRFEGIIGVGDVVTVLAKSLVDFVPGNTITDFLGNIATFGSILKELTSKEVKVKSKMVYIKLSYLNDHSAINLGCKYVYLRSVLYALYGVNPT